MKKKKTYNGPFGIKVVANSYDEASMKILKKVSSGHLKRKHSYDQCHRFVVTNASTQKNRFYLINDDETHRCNYFKESYLDYAPTYYLEKACKGIGYKFPKFNREAYTRDQVMLLHLYANYSSYKLWVDLRKDDHVKLAILGLDTYDSVYVQELKRGKIRMGIYERGHIEVDSLKEGLLGLALSNSQNHKDNDLEEEKVKIDLLERKVKMLEKSIIKLELENERLRWHEPEKVE